METKIDRLSSGFFGANMTSSVNRFLLRSGRVGIQSMYLHMPTEGKRAMEISDG